MVSGVVTGKANYEEKCGGVWCELDHQQLGTSTRFQVHLGRTRMASGWETAPPTLTAQKATTRTTFALLAATFHSGSIFRKLFYNALNGLGSSFASFERWFCSGTGVILLTKKEITRQGPCITGRIGLDGSL